MSRFDVWRKGRIVCSGHDVSTERPITERTMLDIYSAEKCRLDPEEKDLKLEQFFAASKTEWSGHLKKTLVTLNGLMVGPLSLGELRCHL